MSTTSLLTDARDAFINRLENLPDYEAHLRPNLEGLIDRINRDISAFHDNQTAQEDPDQDD